jgi:hypothetical protein
MYLPLIVQLDVRFTGTEAACSYPSEMRQFITDPGVVFFLRHLLPNSSVKKTLAVQMFLWPTVTVATARRWNL